MSEGEEHMKDIPVDHDLSIEELDLLKDTVDALIVHMEHLKQRREQREATS